MESIKNIPQYEPLLDGNMTEAMSRYFQTGGWLTEYKLTEQFECALESFTKMPYCSVVNNGTISLVLALLALGIKPGDKVICPDMTMIATPNAIRLIGAVPVFVDIDRANLCLNLSQTLTAIERERDIKAVMYVTLNGRSHPAAQYDEFVGICNERGIFVIEDSAQSLGSKYDDGTMIGSKANITSFSFSFPKIITTGQGGCLVMKDKALWQRIEKMKDFGRTCGGADIHEDFGINAKFTEMQAVVGLEQIKSIEWRVERKKQMYNLYWENLKDDIAMFAPKDHITPWFVDIFVEFRDILKEKLKARGIGSREIYPPIHSQKIYMEQGEFIETGYCSKHCLWLPSSLTLTDKDIIHICEEVKSSYGQG